MMVAKKPRIVIVGAGMAGLTAASTLHSSSSSTAAFDLCVVEAGDRIGGRICSSEFAGVRVEMGATWIHGIGGSPIYDIARRIGALDPIPIPWERMDGFPDHPITVAEGGKVVDPALDSSIATLYRTLMDSASTPEASAAASADLSVGTFLRRGLEAYRNSSARVGVGSIGGGEGREWSLEALEDALFAMHENTERTYTSADDLATLDLAAESEYRLFPDEEVTIAGGYSRVVEHLAATLPPGMIQMGRKVERIEWRADPPPSLPDGGGGGSPVHLFFEDGSTMTADHAIITVSLGVLKAGTSPVAGKGGLFSPPLPAFKRDAIARLGFGVVNKLFIEHGPANGGGRGSFPFLQLAFEQRHPPESGKTPRWIRRTASICPVYGGANVLLSWFVGREAAELEELKGDEIVQGLQATLEAFSPAPPRGRNGTAAAAEEGGLFWGGGRIKGVKRSRWASDPLFLGSYSYVAVGSCGEDLDLMAEPLPRGEDGGVSVPVSPLQILFAGEATHRTHYSTTHGAYFSGIREANRLLQHYKLLSG